MGWCEDIGGWAEILVGVVRNGEITAFFASLSKLRWPRRSRGCSVPGGVLPVQHPPTQNLPLPCHLWTPYSHVFELSTSQQLMQNLSRLIYSISLIPNMRLVGEIDLGNVTGCFFACSIGGLEKCNHLIASKAK